MLDLETPFIVKFDFDLELVYGIETVSFKNMHNRCIEDVGVYGTHRSLPFQENNVENESLGLLIIL